jgi:hypothetical protein
MNKYRNRDKEVSVKLENPTTESHGLDIDTPIFNLEGELLFGLVKFYSTL